MKATGIVRRIDDLGRVVVPKEIRRTLRIREGDPLEIFTDKDGGIVLKKYSPIGELSEYAKDFASAMESVLDHTVLICDKDSVISASGEHKKEYLSRPISKQLESVIEMRSTHMKNASEAGAAVPIYEGEDTAALYAEIIKPIICEGQTIGAVIILSRNASSRFGEAEERSAQIAAAFLGAQMAQ